MYRDYCIICASYKPLRRYFCHLYFCHTCTRHVNAAMRRLLIDPCASPPDILAISTALDSIVETLQATCTGERITERDWRIARQRWRRHP